jgi:hypothetical protein
MLHTAHCNKPWNGLQSPQGFRASTAVKSTPACFTLGQLCSIRLASITADEWLVEVHPGVLPILCPSSEIPVTWRVSMTAM